jgi:hypothetical protein
MPFYSYRPASGALLVVAQRRERHLTARKCVPIWERGRDGKWIFRNGVKEIQSARFTSVLSITADAVQVELRPPFWQPQITLNTSWTG